MDYPRYVRQVQAMTAANDLHRMRRTRKERVTR